MEVVRRESALADLENAIAFIARETIVAAAEQLQRIEQQAEDQAVHPLLGRQGRLQDTRELVVARTPSLVVYTVTAHVELVRILDGAQAWPPAD